MFMFEHKFQKIYRMSSNILSKQALKAWISLYNSITWVSVELNLIEPSLLPCQKDSSWNVLTTLCSNEDKLNCNNDWTFYCMRWNISFEWLFKVSFVKKSKKTKKCPRTWTHLTWTLSKTKYFCKNKIREPTTNHCF
jgi:hypothetical protein